MLTRANALGWAPFEELTATQINTVDSQLPNAVDGVAGGDYDPTEWIQLLGVNNRGIKWMDPTWPALEVREQIFYRPFVPVSMTAWGASADNWLLAGSNADWRVPVGHGGAIQQNYVDTAGSPNVPTITFDLGCLPDGCSAKAVGVVIYQETASAGAIASPPQLQAFKKSVSADGAPANPSGHVTATASATYNQANTVLEATFTPQNLDGFKLFGTLYGEAGANAQDDMRILCVYLKANVSFLRYGG